MEILSESFKAKMNHFRKIPLEILIMIIEILDLKDACQLCEALMISIELAYQYHKFDKMRFMSKIYDYQNRKITNPNLAKALFKNSIFQLLAEADDKVTIAILSQDLELVRNALKDPKVDHDDIYYNALHFAFTFGLSDVAKLVVIEHGNKISNLDIKKMADAIQLTNEDIVEFLLAESMIDPSIISAAEHGHVEIIKLLLADPRVDPSDQKNEAIISAARYSRVEICKILLSDPRVNPSAKCNDAFYWACCQPIKCTEIVKLLLSDPRVNPSSRNNQAIIYATVHGHEETVRILLADSRVDPSDQNNRALLFAARSKNMKMVKLLLADERIDKSITQDPEILEAFEKSELGPFVKRLRFICGIRYL